MTDTLVNVSVGQLLDRAVREHHDRTAYVSRGVRLTYSDLAARVDAYARALLALDVAVGDRVAIWMPNDLHWVLMFLATVRIGAVVVPMNTSFRQPEATYVLEQSEASIVVLGGRVRDRDLISDGLEIAWPGQGSVAKVLTATQSEKAGLNVLSIDEALSAGVSVPDQTLAVRYAGAQAQDPIVILYTSGTTGFPKGAMDSHKVIRNMAAVGQRLEITHRDTLVLYLPLFHAFALTTVFTFIHAGAAIVLMERFDAGASLETIEKQKATVVYGIPTMYYDQLNHPSFRDCDLSSIRICLTAGTGDMVRRIDNEMGLALNFFGMTETASMTTVPNVSDPIEKRADTVGYPMPGADIRIADENGVTLPADSPGEILVRGYPLTLGYFRKPDATAESFDGAGWFRTGDRGEMTRDGYLKFMGRLKDVLRVGGENVDPVEVETQLMRHPAVSMAAVIGVPHERLNEAPVAYVQLRTGATATPAEIEAFMKFKLAGFKTPREIYVLDALPRTGSGKVDKRELKRFYAAAEKSVERVGGG